MEFWNNLLGLTSNELKASQMAARAVIVFFTSLVFIRIAGIRTLGKQSAFDTLTSLMLGAIMGRSVVTGREFFGYMLAALVIMLLHRFVAWITFKSKSIGAVIKGSKLLLMKDGKLQQSNLASAHITEEDIMEALRQSVNSSVTDKIKEVYLERSGRISVVKE